jgi:hypothetical protein
MYTLVGEDGGDGARLTGSMARLTGRWLEWRWLAEMVRRGGWPMIGGVESGRGGEMARRAGVAGCWGDARVQRGSGGGIEFEIE